MSFRSFPASLTCSTLLLLLTLPMQALAQQVTATTAIGDTVTNPATGESATVIQMIGGYAVLTDSHDIILMNTAIGSSYTPANGTHPVTVVDVILDPTSGLPVSIVIDPNDRDNPPATPAPLVTVQVTHDIGQEMSDAIALASGGPSGISLPTTTPTGNVNRLVRTRTGSHGGDGNNGYGLEVCDPFGVLGCAIIGYGGTEGDDGGTYSALTYNLGSSHGNIQSTSNGADGVSIVSVGGNGGDGGDAYGNFDGLRGGNAGAGGTVTVTSNVSIATSGTSAHGIYGQSRAGISGDGGSGYIFGGGGDGGTASRGGTVTLTNNGAINTLGNAAHGLFAQSVGGSAGSGGNSWGVVGSAGSSRLGGHGGTATVSNNGTIVTDGIRSYGMFAQSVGGTGGDGGDSGGIVALGGTGSAGGNGGSARAYLGTNGQILTTGERSFGMFAQSIGGGGGDGGVGGGLVALGGSGSAGGSGGAVTITNQAGSEIYTEGWFAHGVLGQSVGGGGGNGATGGGVVAIGGSGTGAGNGGTVTITSGADILTSGLASRGLYGLSVGGGGGTASGTGGFVSIGGRGGAGGNGGAVTITNSGTVVTQDIASDAIFAQSIGGGGGSGAGSGGVVSIGGSGNSGGSASTVDVTNNGVIATGAWGSRGIFAQSIGGGGGSGGHSGGLAAIGGSAARTSNGNRVTVTNNGSVATAGNNSNGIQAQSVGGGGGDGGTTGGVFLTMGGRGGGGGSANVVTVNNNGNILTEGNDSDGIFAQSVGGGGGNAGSGASLSAFAGVSIGGRGGSGGNGSTVNVNTNEHEVDFGDGPVTVRSVIQTEGDRSNGIFAQSVGGGGGNGGFAIQGTGGTFLSASVAIGGSAGVGGRGGTVNLDSTASIITAGEDSEGILAQSVGGGGGNGGFAISGSIQANPAGGGAVAVGIGGSGGSGGNGGTVDADFEGSIQTAGDRSDGYVAQSVGGGGGNGGFSIAGAISGGGAGSGAVAVGVGGSGGTGGNGGLVTATSDGTVITQGDDATGVLFQSVGGGGGNGGYNVSAGLSAAGVGSGAVNVGVGGSGSSGGTGGVVDGTVSGIVATSGSHSDAIVVQSVGGGGGNGGFNVGVAASGASTGSGALNVGVGGSGARGGSGGEVTATINADVLTTGEGASAALIQSVGGGGGNAGFSVDGAFSIGGVGAAVDVAIGGSGGGGGDGATVIADLNGNFQTTGDSSSAVLAQSVGGGGGNANVNIGLAGASGVGVSFGLGGGAGDAGDGANVTLTHVGDVLTEGYDSTGVHAQSVGGGGGNTSLSVATGYSTIGKIDVGIGRVGGIGGTGGDVDLTTDGTITTLGDSSVGVLAQSIGNGGGKSGSHSFGVGITQASVSLGLGLGLEGGQGGTAGDVDVTTEGRVQTQGNESHAVYAQSIGGGGGIGGMALLPVLKSSTIGAAIGGTGGTGGVSGTVTADNLGELLTVGDDANAIFAQSVGGGGGNGGIAATVGISTGPINATLAVGGTGGTGADSGGVIVTNEGIIDTRGARSNGVLAQNIGGGGGNGGIAINAVGTVGNVPGFNAALGIVLGGTGGTGGVGGDTTVTNTGIIATAGDQANGILAQSIGGGGGNGGLTANLMADRTPGGGQIGVTIGGTGGTGGTGGAVVVDNLVPDDGSDGGIIFTTGRESHGIFAQSIGGGGGNGSSTIAMNGTSGEGNLQVGVAVGGRGGLGGTGGTVTVTNGGLIETQGDGAHGVYAQSIGGGGGNGGLAIGANVIFSANQQASFAPLFVMGGAGGDGNDGGNVVVNNDGNILTSGEAAHGVVAQSIGGGGGDSALAVGLSSNLATASTFRMLAGPLFSALGSSGSNGGLGGDVTVNHAGDITTLGDGSEAIGAQSINGGGGGMHVDFDGITSIADQFAAGLDPDFEGTRWENEENGDDESLWRFDLGAFESEDAAAGTVIVNTTGTINTAGADSIGQAIQGIGGGGGVLQFRAALAADADAGTQIPVAMRLGGIDGQRNDGGDLDATHVGDHLSTGTRAHGALVQSIGGGGGRGTIDVEIGFDHAANIDLALGGLGGTDESGGTVSYQRDGNLVTTGDQSFGTAVQSIGGGGGVAAVSVDALGSNGVGAVNASITMGADSGTNLNGGDLDIALDGDLLTQGAQSHGLFMQSIGGGGGLGFFNGDARTFDISLGSLAGAIGNGGAINLANAGNIWTEGDTSHGVLLQSIGGGGGAVFTGTDSNVTLNTGGTGDGGAISFTQTGDIVTSGAGSYGIFAQSLGGGGGIVNDEFAGAAGGVGAGGSINLQIDGNVVAQADGGTAILVQSDGIDGGGDIDINVSGDSAVIGGAGGSGITIMGGNNNSITVDGIVATIDDLDGVAINIGPSAARGNDTVRNFGTTMGSIMLGNGDNFYRNEVGGIFLSGSSVQVDTERTGAAAVGALINFGMLAPGGSGQAVATVIDGRFVQGDTGVFATELDLSRSGNGAQLDSLLISGSALLGGTVDLSLSNFGYVMPGQFEDVLFEAAGGIGAFEGMLDDTTPIGTVGTTPTVAVSGIPNSAVANFEVNYTGNAAVLSSDINFAADGLNNNQASLGQHINDVQLAGGSQNFVPIASTLFFTETADELGDTYDSLSPYAYADAISHSLLSNARFGERLLSCTNRRGDPSARGETRCRWMRLGTLDLQRDQTSEFLSFSQDGIELSGGFEHQLDGDRAFGAGLSFLRSESVSAGLAENESDLYQLGLVYAQPLGRFRFTATGSAGVGSFETTRLVELLPVSSEIATGKPRVSFGSVHGRLSHDLVREKWYLRSSLDVGMNYLSLKAFSEDGAPVIGLDIPSMSDTFVSLHPSFEIGGHLDGAGTLSYRPYARLGYIALGIDGVPELSARFLGGPLDSTPFLFESGLETDYAELALGLDVLNRRNNLLRIEANGIRGSATTGYGIEASWSYLFN